MPRKSAIVPNRFADFLEISNRRLGQGVAWLSLAMVVLMCVNVAARYAFNSTLVWQQELVMFMHAILFMSASGYTLLEDKHVRVDVLYQHFSARAKAWVSLFGTLVFLFPVIGVIGWCSTSFIIRSWTLLEASREYNGMPGIFLLKTVIWIFCASLALQGLANICRAYDVLFRSKKRKKKAS
jgi:TRAP-type mannitol/chloroaromatic compound transport system permease small subunit